MELLTFLQPQLTPQSQENILLNQQPEFSQIEPGLFDALITEFTAQEPEEKSEILISIPDAEKIETEPKIMTMTFKSNNSFSQSVINILAENPPEIPEDEAKAENLHDNNTDDDEVKFDTEVENKEFEFEAEKIKIEIEKPEEQPRLIQNESEIKTENKNKIEAPEEVIIEQAEAEYPEEIQPLNKRVETPRIKENNKKSESKSEIKENKTEKNSQEVPDEIINISGVPTVVNAAANNNENLESGFDDVENEAQEQHQNKTTVKNPKISEIQINNDNPEITAVKNSQSQRKITKVEKAEDEKTKFRGVFEAEIESENETENKPQNFSGNEHRDNDNENENHENSPSADKIESSVTPRKSTNSTQRSQVQNQNSNTTASRKTESHNNFQGFFEGVLNNRRTVSRNSPLPLNLKSSNVNFNQSQTLREGLVNTVRFVRADGVQKANIVIDPPALGRISVELTSGTSGVEASIKVSSEQIRQLVQDQISQLRMNLSEQGVQVAEFTVDVQQDNSGHGGQNNSQNENYQRRQQGIIGGVAGDETEEFQIDLEEGLLYWVA